MASRGLRPTNQRLALDFAHDYQLHAMLPGIFESRTSSNATYLGVHIYEVRTLGV